MVKLFVLPGRSYWKSCRNPLLCMGMGDLCCGRLLDALGMGGLCAVKGKIIHLGHGWPLLRAASVEHPSRVLTCILFRCLQNKRQKVFSVCSVHPPAPLNSKFKRHRVGVRRPAKKKTHPARPHAEPFINFELGGRGGRTILKPFQNFCLLFCRHR